MGVSGKWIKALVGLKKSEKSQSSEKDEKVDIYVFYFSFLLFFCWTLFTLCLFLQFNLGLQVLKVEGYNSYTLPH